MACQVGVSLLSTCALPYTAPLAQVALAAISIAICYADRSNISTAIIPMSEQFGWETSWQGIILSMFFLGYLLTQLLGGEHLPAC